MMTIQLHSATDETQVYYNSPTKHKHHLLPIVAILIIILILTSSFIIFITNSNKPDSNKPDIPTINPPYTTPELLWKTEAPGGSSVYPVVSNGVIYAYHDYNIKGYVLTAINMTNGDIMWQTRGFETDFAPSDIKDIIYTSRIGYIMAWNATDGTKIWTKDISGYYLVVVNDILYLKSGSTVRALNAADGTYLWHYSVSSVECLMSSLAVANGAVYVSCSGNNSLIKFDNFVIALDALNGNILWNTTIGGPGHARSNPVVSNDIVYVGSDDHKLCALNATTGKILWKHTLDGTIGSPVVEYGAVYVSTDKSVYALNAQTGKKIWNCKASDITKASNIANSDGQSIAVADGVVYALKCCRTDNNIYDVLYALNAATGKKLWSNQCEEGYLTIVIADKQIYLLGSNRIYALSTIQPLTSP
jgi:glucose dehydrogenase